MKRYLCAIVALVILSLLCMPVSAATCERHITEGLPIGAVCYYEDVDNNVHNICYTCADCGEKVVAYTEAHNVAEIDSKCIFCGYKVCLHEYIDKAYSRNDADTHIKVNTCKVCGERTETTEAHEYAGNICVECGLEVTPPADDTTEDVTPPADDTTEGGDDATTPPPTGNEDQNGTVTTSEEIVNWIKENIEEIAVICTTILTAFLTLRKLAMVIKSAITMNNNAITVSEKSDASVNKALEGVQEASATVGSYVDAMNELLTEVRGSTEEKQKLMAKLDEASRFINTAKLANVELANEMAELLVLANIPNAKKEELYSRHRAAVNAIAAAEETEVKADAEVAEES